MNPGLARLAGALPACFLLAAAAANGTAEPKADLLYAPPDASAPGEIRGTVAAPARPLEKVLAIPAEDPRRVYRADIEEPDKRAFRFRGLPMDRYDLIAIYEDAFYEGLRLTREENSLTASDVSEIDAIIQRSEPFFTHKIVHRLAGTAGRGGEARAICTFYRDKPAETYMFVARVGYRRTFKLVLLQHVGPGWQVVRTRDLHPIWTEPARQRPRHEYRALLSNIRVTDSVRDVGALNLEP